MKPSTRSCALATSSLEIACIDVMKVWTEVPCSFFGEGVGLDWEMMHLVHQSSSLSEFSFLQVTILRQVFQKIVTDWFLD